MSAIKFLDNIYFDDNVEIQMGDPSTPEGKIYGNSSGLFLEAVGQNKLLALTCPSTANGGLMTFGYGGANYFFFMNSINGSTEIRFSNSKVFETISGGVKVTGELQTTGDIEVNTNKFTVTASTGNVTSAGGISATGNLTTAASLAVTGGYRDSNGSYGTSGQVLSSSGSQTTAWTTSGSSSGPANQFTLGGRCGVSTSVDAGAGFVYMAGSLGANYYNWTQTQTGKSFQGAGTPGTTTQNFTSYVALTNGCFKINKGGTAYMEGIVEYPSQTEVRNEDVHFFLWKVPTNAVTAMGNGTYVGSSITCTLLASTTLTVPSSSQNIIPMNFTATSQSVSEGDFVFATLSFDGTVTGTRYFITNYQVYVK
jgi:hypothetical protein